ncbi:MAG: YbfB/YjiJ family MFS transporter [Burkholderiaceae bacterium]
MSLDSVPRDDRRDRRIAWSGLFAMACAMGIGRFAYTPVLPHLQADAALSTAMAGYIASANFIGYLIGAVLGSFGYFRPRRFGWAMTGVVASIVTTAAMGWTGDPLVWSLLRLVSGIASAFVLIFGVSLVLEHLNRVERPMWAALVFTGVGLGIAGSALLVDACTRIGASSSSMWQALAVAALGLGVAAIRWMPSPSSGPAATRAAPPEPLSPLTRRTLRLATIAYGGLGFGYVISATFIVVITRQLQLGQWAETLVWVVTGLSAIPSNVLWLRCAQRWGFFKALMAAYAVEAAGVVLISLSTGMVGLLAGAVMLGSTFMALTVLILGLGRQLAPTHLHRITGTTAAAFAIGQIAGPAVAGAIAERSGSFVLPSLLAGAVLLAAIILTAIAERRYRAGEPGRAA